ncbi:outer membrane beta-barrel protein [Salinimonas lutimaris]|uniref:outer membrane beta-barrel protein n=1 Tax=Salinimonas lutimaris TaxID=914153 RepID=UPI001586E6D7|nr:outer membrane beta-barrel protein [Salinimonas lutimaris]
MKYPLLLCALGAASLPAMAVSPAWDYVQATYVQADIESPVGDFKPKGVIPYISKKITDDIFVAGSYSQIDDTWQGVDMDVTQGTAGVGYRYGLNQTTDVYGILSYEYADIEYASALGTLTTDDDGYGLTAGVRSMVMPNVELKGSVRYIDTTDSTTSVNVGADYLISPEFAVGLNYDMGDDVDVFGVNARYNF